LLLAPHIDRLFDRGWITFRADGVIQISEDLDHYSKACLGLSAAEDRGVGAFSAEQERYLEYHHENVFIGGICSGQLVDPIDLVVGDAAKDIGQPSLWIDAVELGGFDKRLGDCCRLSSALRASKKPIFAERI
jgi:hypothetical protein